MLDNCASEGISTLKKLIKALNSIRGGFVGSLIFRDRVAVLTVVVGFGSSKLHSMGARARR